MTDPKYNGRLMNLQGKVSDNVLSDMLAFSYPRVQGGPVVAYNNIDAGTQNVRCGTGVAKRQDGEGSCNLEPLSSASTSTTVSALTSASEAASASAIPSGSTSTTAARPEVPKPVETLLHFGTPENQCPSLQFDTCSCYCLSYEDCGFCATPFETVCTSVDGTTPGCCQCE